mmetsp:Transcript_39979/g.93852  ORF Transcript_39979/g.93852 Transcript_39979/m.93852 type:complete len:272 (+) Transcript_39979:1265-2080(+)
MENSFPVGGGRQPRRILSSLGRRGPIDRDEHGPRGGDGPAPRRGGRRRPRSRSRRHEPPGVPDGPGKPTPPPVLRHGPHALVLGILSQLRLDGHLHAGPLPPPPGPSLPGQRRRPLPRRLPPLPPRRVALGPPRPPRRHDPGRGGPGPLRPAPPGGHRQLGRPVDGVRGAAAAGDRPVVLGGAHGGLAGRELSAGGQAHLGGGGVQPGARRGWRSDPGRGDVSGGRRGTCFAGMDLCRGLRRLPDGAVDRGTAARDKGAAMRCSGGGCRDN